MTRGDLIFKVSRKIGLSEVTGDELTLMNTWANEAVVDVLMRTHCCVTLTTMNLSAGTEEYRLATTVLAIDDGYGNVPTTIGPYKVISVRDMLARRAATPVSGGRKYLAFNGNLMTVSPVPAAGEVLSFYQVTMPTLMSNDAHDPATATYGGIPVQFHRALEYYMLWQASEYDDKAGPSGDAARATREQYEKELVLVRKGSRSFAGRGLTGARVGYPGMQAIRSNRNDVY